MDDNEKRRIKPVIVEEDGEQVPSVDSVDSPVEQEDQNTTPESKADNSTIDRVETESTIISEDTKDGMEEVKAQPTTSNESPFTDIGIIEPPKDVTRKKSKWSFVIIMILVALVVALLAGGIYVYINGTQGDNDNDEVTTLPSPTPLPTTEPETTTSPSPEATDDLAKYKVSILNGSGKIGEAGKVKSALEKVGFKITNTGNAANFSFEETVIQVKASTPKSVVDQIKATLEDNYTLEVGDELKSTSTYDIVITVGSK